MRLYIRGKPWIITIDDNMLFNGPSFAPTLKFAGYGQVDKDKAAMWGPLLEKAWAKMKGTYEGADGGFLENGLRALTGCPVFTYKSID